MGGKSGRVYLIIGPAMPHMAVTIKSKIYDLTRSLDTFHYQPPVAGRQEVLGECYLTV